MTESPRTPRRYGRRDMLKLTGATLAGGLMPSLVSCRPRREEPAPARLTARPGIPTRPAPPKGSSPLALSIRRDGDLYVPSGYAGAATPLLVLLHGAGGSGENWTSFPARAEKRGLILLMPDSRGATWDLMHGAVGPDIAFLDRALHATFDRCNIDPARVAIGGFSDGASYALHVGLAHGDLFTRIIAYSPGFLTVPRTTVGKPRVFDSHGTEDQVLPVAGNRDRIVPTLRERGYDVTYRHFVGGHTVPTDVADESLDWLARDA